MFENALSPTDVTLFGITSSVRPFIPLKALALIVVTVFGIDNPFSPLIPLNADVPIVSNPSFNSRFLTVVPPSNKESFAFVTSSANLTLSIIPVYTD